MPKVLRKNSLTSFTAAFLECVKRPAIAAALLCTVLLAGCNADGSTGDSIGSGGGAVQSGPVSVPIGTRKFSTDVLLYNGAGAWGAEVTNLQNIMQGAGITYQAVSSDELNAMTPEQFAQFGAIVWPGGEAGTQANSLTQQTKENLRAAVQKTGVGWLGFCAGSFIAVEPASRYNSSNPEYGLGIVDQPILKYYYLEQKDTQDGVADINLTMEAFADGSSHNILWYGGPTTPGGPGVVVAKYPTSDPAISQLWSGNGLVMLSGVHPTAALTTLQALGVNPPDGDAQAIALKLLNAVLHQKVLPTFAN